MIKKLILSLLALTLVFPVVHAQYFTNASRLSFTQINGTARSAAMGNAFGALGGDFTSLSINPAGIAIYRGNEFTFTPTFGVTDTEIPLGNNLYSDLRYNIQASNIGYVGTMVSTSSSTSVVSVNFGVGFNRLSDFNQNYFMENAESAVSFLDGIAEWATTEGLSNAYLSQNMRDIYFMDWHAALAWKSFLINPSLDNGGNEIDEDYIPFNTNNLLDQSKTFKRRGGVSEYVFSAGLNFNHKFYLGGTIGIHDVYLKQTTTYSEQFENGDSFSFDENYKLTGTGYVLKIGAIYKPTQQVRLGLAFHTPTYYDLEESSYLAMTSQIDNEEGVNLFTYDFFTPMKTIASAAFVINKKAIISIDGEYIDYATMRFRNGMDGDNMSDLNAVMDDNYKNTFNLRLGGEFKVNPQLSLRGGYEYYGNPYKTNVLLNEETIKENLTALSLGIGYAENNFFIDAAYKQYSGENNLVEVQPNMIDLPMKYNNKKVMLTLGFKF